MYPASAWSVLSSRPSWISARLRSHYETGLDRAIWVTSVRMRREDRSSISSHPLADLGGNSCTVVGYVIDRSLSCAVPLFVPRARSFVPACASSIASRAGAVKAGRYADLTPRSAAARPRLDGAEHGARIKQVGRLHHWSCSFRTGVLWPAPPRRCGRACWRARSPARCGAVASGPPRSTT
jgi:hypothetical protein